VNQSCEPLSSRTDGNDADTDNSSDDSDDETEVIDTDFTGTKCRAPYTHSWGEMSFHNAIIVSILSGQSQVCSTLYYFQVMTCFVDRLNYHHYHVLQSVAAE